MMGNVGDIFSFGRRFGDESGIMVSVVNITIFLGLRDMREHVPGGGDNFAFLLPTKSKSPPLPGWGGGVALTGALYSGVSQPVCYIAE